MTRTPTRPAPPRLALVLSAATVMVAANLYGAGRVGVRVMAGLIRRS